eukprot:m.23789 g.23789  ORF g.23789 m.23789 type:complete len:81 (-) comp5586_c0_seq1:884-1126(-)
MTGESSQVVGSSQRKACWKARDAYYDCMAKEGENSCTELKAAFDKLCPQAWVEHFQKMKAYSKYKEKLMNEGYKLKKEEK